jgi:NADH-quinone oxidoreductase subunit J
MRLSQAGASQIGMVKTLGVVLFKDFLFPFEIASVLLLAAMVGAIMLGKKEIK